MNPINLSLDVIITVVILFTFLSSFFFLYISKVEEDAFKSEIGDLIEKNLSKVLVEHPEVKSGIRAAIPVLSSVQKLYEAPDNMSKERNKMVKFAAGFVVIFLVGVLLTIILTLSKGCNQQAGVGQILMKNLVIFAIVGVVEYLFFTRVAIKYVPASPSLMVDTIISSLKKDLQS